MDTTSVFSAVVGSGIGTAIVGSLFKYGFDKKLELQRAYLSRASRVHEKQVDTLSKLHGHFTEIRAYLQLMQKSSMLEGETPEEYPKQLGAAIDAARDVLTFGRLLVPSDIGVQCDLFFEKIFESQHAFAFSRWQMVQDIQVRLKSRDKATELSYSVIPKLLNEIERSARDIIHGESAAVAKAG